MWTCYTLLPVLLLSLGAVHALIIGDENETRFRCYDGSFSSYYDFNFNNPTPLLKSSCYNSSRDTVIFTYGFGGSNTGPYVQALAEALLQAKYNVILAIWEKYNSAGIGDAGYPIAAANALIYGEKCGKALVSLFKAGLSLPSVRLIGFSLGAHFMGEAAVTCKNAGFTITLLIGLDPAGPLFTGLLSLGGIGPKDAAFVLIIHTNPGRMGTSESKGTVDLWMNCGNPVQPGCAAAEGGIGIATPESSRINILKDFDCLISPGNAFNNLTDFTVKEFAYTSVQLNNMCSHNFAWKYFIEAGQNANTFIGIIASSCDNWINGNEGNLTYTLGYNVMTGVQGNFYMSTNSASPYGRSEAGLNP